MNETLRKKYIPMTETTYYTLLAVMAPRHGYAIMQYVSSLTEGRIVLGTGTLYTMVGRLVADGVIEVALGSEKKTYSITPAGLELLQEETERLGQQLADGVNILSGGHERRLVWRTWRPRRPWKGLARHPDRFMPGGCEGKAEGCIDGAEAA